MSRTLARIRRCALLTVLVARAPAAGAERDVPREVLEDDWMVVRIDGQPAGRLHSTVVREGDEIITDSKTVIEMARGGVKIRTEVSLTCRETADGRPLVFTMRQDIAAYTVEIEGKFEGDKLNLVSRTMGQERKRTVDWPAGALFGYAMDKFIRSAPQKRGSEFSFMTYVPDRDKVVDITYRVGEAREIDVMGRRVRATRMDVSGVGLPLVEYRDDEGVVWKQETGAMGFSIEMLRTTRETAERRTGRPARFDVLLDLSVRVRTRLPRPREVTSALYRLRLKEGSVAELALEAPGQRLERTEKGGSALLRVTSVRPDPERVLPHPIRDPGMKKYLDASTYVQSDDPEIVRVAREVVSDVRSSYDAAKGLELWVFRNITDRGFDRGFATAKEVMQDRAGDCSEHAVLLCALLRAAGIPARGAVGLLYFEMLPGRGSFAYHMWTEAYVGRWVPLDATLAGTAVDATHIRLAELDLAGMSPAAGMIELFNVFGQLGIEVVEYAVGKRTVRPSDKGPSSVVVGSRFRDLDYGVSLAAPEGWELAPPGDRRGERGAIATLVRRGGEEQETKIALFAVDVPPGRMLSEAVEKQMKRGRYTVEGRKTARLGGRAALRLSYRSRGQAREGIAAKREGTLYILRLDPRTAPGSEALTKVAESFRFE